MKLRVGMWGAAGFLAAGAWALLIFATTLEQFLFLMSVPVMRVLLYLSCPVAYFGHRYSISLWSVLLMNAATFALFGLMVEVLRSKLKQHAT